MSRLSTLPADLPERQITRVRRGWMARRVFAVLLGLFLLAAAANLFGVRTASESTTAGGIELSVDYASISRPGLATPFSITVRTLDGQALPESISLQTTSAYLAQFDENGLDPEPVESYADGELTTWVFEPDNDRLTVDFDARLEPGLRIGVEGETRLAVDERVVASVGYRTWVTP